MDPIAEFWSEMLSGEAERARRAFAPLSADEQQAILLHLRRMTTEPGWHPAQMENARAALDALLQQAG
ncbi:MAG: hypothetical protein HYZ26_05480 [Chloroflexi bacterium]|nr:hypothetical protein [Chloroflexota bacterium]